MLEKIFKEEESTSINNTLPDKLFTIPLIFLSAGEVAYAISFYDFYAEEAKRITGDILQCNATGVTKRMLVTKASGE